MPTALLILIAAMALCALPVSHAFQIESPAPPLLPVRADLIPRHEICQRLGLKESGGNALAIGAGPHMTYALANEHEVLCPVTGAHQGVLCTAVLPPRTAPVADRDAAAVACDRDLASQAILAGALAVSLRDPRPDGNGVYYLPTAVALGEAPPAAELARLDWEPGRTAFNSDGLETNEVVLDMSPEAAEPAGPAGGERVTLYARGAGAGRRGASADVYVLPRERRGKIWRFTVEFAAATIDLRQISSFGSRDSTTPLRPEVRLEDDAH